MTQIRKALKRNSGLTTDGQTDSGTDFGFLKYFFFYS